MGFTDALKSFFSGGTEASSDPAVRAQGRQALQTLLDDQANTDKELAKAGVELVDAVLGTSIAGLEGISEQLADIQSSWEELFQPLEEIDPEKFKSKVVRADDALNAIQAFKLENLKKFYFDKFGDLEQNAQAFFSEGTQTHWLDQMKKGQFQTIITEVLKMVQEILDAALDIKALIDPYDAMMRDMLKKVLAQTKPEIKVDGPHRTRRNPG